MKEEIEYKSDIIAQLEDKVKKTVQFYEDKLRQAEEQRIAEIRGYQHVNEWCKYNYCYIDVQDDYHQKNGKKDTEIKKLQDKLKEYSHFLVTIHVMSISLTRIFA